MKRFINDAGDSIVTHCGAIEPDFSGFDTAEDILRDAAKWGLLERIRDLLGVCVRDERADRLRIARDIAYELAGAKDRDFAVDLLVHATGADAFGASSLREFGGKHGCSHEWFRKQADAMRERLDFPGWEANADDAA